MNKASATIDDNGLSVSNSASDERRKGDRRQWPTRRLRHRRRRIQIPAFLPLLLIAALSLTLLLVVYSWQSAKTINAETQLYGESITKALANVSNEALTDLIAEQGQSPMLQNLKQHPHFLYFLVESKFGERQLVLEGDQSGIGIPSLPLSASQRVSQGNRAFTTLKKTVGIVEFYAPIKTSGSHVLRIGFLKPTFYWQPGAQYYFLISLPLVLLTFAAFSSIFSTYLPMHRLGQHFSSMNEGKEFETIDNSQTKSPLIDDFNALIANAKNIVREIEVKQDALEIDRKVLYFDKLRTEAVLDALPLGVAVLDVAGSVTYCNKQFLHFFPGASPDIVGKSFSEWSPSLAVAAYVQSGRKSGGVKPGELQYDYAQRGNHSKVASVSMQTVQAADSGNSLGELMIIQDVTSTLHNKRMSEEFAIKAAHELKTPLHVVKMYSEMLMEDDLEPDVRVESLNTIYDEVDRMADLVNNLLNIAKIEMGNITIDKTRVKTSEFLNDIYDSMIRSANNSTLTVVKDIPESLSTIVVDKDLLRISINNLLSNAIKYNREGGEVRFAAEETDDAILISISDSGPGISEEDQRHIFDKFYRSEDAEIRKKSGHGLGLTLTRNIVQLHHGSLTVDSTLGEGSRFTIAFNKKSNIVERGRV